VKAHEIHRFTFFCILPFIFFGSWGWLAYFLFMLIYIPIWYYFSSFTGCPRNDPDCLKRFYFMNIFNFLCGSWIAFFPDQKVTIGFIWLLVGIISGAKIREKLDEKNPY
jgi:hypothetical protein